MVGHAGSAGILPASSNGFTEVTIEFDSPSDVAFHNGRQDACAPSVETPLHPTA